MTARAAATSGMIVAIVIALGGCSAPLIPQGWGSWERVGVTGTPTPIPGHEEPFRASYVNPVGETARPTVEGGVTKTLYPPGSVIVKAGFRGSVAPGPAETPAKLYAMVKRPDDPRARGGWVWVVRNGNDPREIVVDAPYCVDCHGYANAPNPYGDKNPNREYRDYVFLPYRAAGQQAE